MTSSAEPTPTQAATQAATTAIKTQIATLLQSKKFSDLGDFVQANPTHWLCQEVLHLIQNKQASARRVKVVMFARYGI